MRFVLVALLSLPLFAQHHGESHQPSAITLEEGLGRAHYPVSTKNAEAQKYFDQGLRYVYAFHHEQAVASFRKAIELDPDLAIGYWGIGLALGPNINMDVDPESEKSAWRWVQEAMKRRESASQKERDLIEALGKRYSKDASADRNALNAAFAEAMRAVHARYPDDADVATLYAESLMDLRPWKFWTRDGKPNEGTEEIVRVLEGVLKKAPNHAGANHYYIHAVEASRNPGRAIRSAERLQTLAPAAGHLVHMPAHIFQRTGRYDAAARANVNGADADRAFIAKYGQSGIYPAMYYNHNLHFGAYSYMMDGQYVEAMKLAGEVAKNASAMAKDVPDVEAIVATPILTKLRFGRWEEILEWPDPKSGPISTALRHLARGVAFARRGNVAAAESERKLLEGKVAEVPEKSMMFQSSPKDVMKVAVHVLAGRIAEARGDMDSAIAAYRKAVEAEDSLNYNEPSDWFYPVRETLGGALLRSGEAAAAAAVFGDDLQRNPNNPRSLFGLAEALTREGKTAAASKARADYDAAWKRADSKLALPDL
jgi:tetratricopeptide (TPR) repeat protein